MIGEIRFAARERKKNVIQPLVLILPAMELYGAPNAAVNLS